MAAAKVKRKAPENMKWWKKNRTPTVTATLELTESNLINAMKSGWDARNQHPNANSLEVSVSWRYENGTAYPVLDWRPHYIAIE